MIFSSKSTKYLILHDISLFLQIKLYKIAHNGRKLLLSYSFNLETHITAVCACWKPPTSHHPCARHRVQCRCKGGAQYATRNKLTAYMHFLFFYMKAHIISFLFIYNSFLPQTSNMDFFGPRYVLFCHILHVARN